MPSRVIRNALLALLLLLQACLSVILWLVNPRGAAGAGTFAVLLGADLLALALVAHIYRVRWGEDIGLQ